jgi:nucleotide-binding universal stress UspA family protein
VDVDADHPAPDLTVRHQLNLQILEMAVSLALADFAELHVAHAWEAIGENAMRGPFLAQPDSEVDEYVDQVRELHSQELTRLLKEVIDKQKPETVKFLNPQQHLIKGLPRKEIPALAERLGADLVVMGTVARTGVPGLFIGNTAEAMLEQIECSVLAVKPEGFKTPVSLKH